MDRDKNLHPLCRWQVISSHAEYALSAKRDLVSFAYDILSPNFLPGLNPTKIFYFYCRMQVENIYSDRVIRRFCLKKKKKLYCTVAQRLFPEISVQWISLSVHPAVFPVERITTASLNPFYPVKHVREGARRCSPRVLRAGVEYQAAPCRWQLISCC